MDNIYIMFITLLTSNCFSIGMDLAKQTDNNASLLSTRRKTLELNMAPKIYPIEYCEQILNIPMKDIRCSVEKLSCEQQQKFKHVLTSNLTFNIAMLPNELCLKILCFAYDEDDQRYNSDRFFITPMIQAITLYKNFKKNPIKIGGKEIQFGTFLMLSQEERRAIRSAVNPSRLSSFFDGTSDSVLSSENYETIAQLLSYDLEGAQVIRLPSFWQRLKLGLCGDYEVCDTSKRCLMLSLLASMQLSWGLGRVLCDNGYPVAGAISYSIGGIIDAGILIGGALYGISQCRNYIVVVTLAQSDLAV